MTLKDKFTYRLLHVISRRLRRLPNSSRSRFANKLGALAFNRIPIRKKQAIQNIKTAFPDKNGAWVNHVLKGSYRLVSTNFMEFLALPKSFDSLNFPAKVVATPAFEKTVVFAVSFISRKVGAEPP